MAGILTFLHLSETKGSFRLDLIFLQNRITGTSLKEKVCKSCGASQFNQMLIVQETIQVDS